MALFRIVVSDSRSSKDRSKYTIARYGKNENEVMAELGINHRYLSIYSIKEVYV